MKIQWMRPALGRTLNQIEDVPEGEKAVVDVGRQQIPSRQALRDWFAAGLAAPVKGEKVDPYLQATLDLYAESQKIRAANAGESEKEVQALEKGLSDLRGLPSGT